ncbi:cytochrome P450 [Aspergillus unguis]
MLPLVAAGLFVGVWGCYGLALLVYRLWFSPLAKFPGPKIAAATVWYENYHDAIRWGQYAFEIEKMHKKYGPIVRISPHELHVNDPDFYEVLYSRNSPRNKYDYFTQQFGLPRSAFATVDHYHHRLLRSNMNPYFSTARVRKQEPLIQGLVDKLCARLLELKGSDTPVNLQYALTCFTTDVVSDYTMGTGLHYLDEPDFLPDWTNTIVGSAKSGVYIKAFPWLGLVFRLMPQWLLSRLYHGMDLALSWHKRAYKLALSIIDERNAEGYEKVRSQFAQPTFFHDVLDSNLPAEEKTPERLAQEVVVVIGAGTETTAKMLNWTIYRLLENPEKMDKLKEELDRLDPDQKATLIDFEQMPLSYGVSSRLQRIAPDRDLQFNEWSIPAGTPVGMSSCLIHHDERIFPDSHEFIPERWLEPERRKYLERYLVSFTKGSRQCIGINLARAEILLALPHLIRRINFELYETTREDVKIAHDLFIACAKEGSKGVRVLVR